MGSPEILFIVDVGGTTGTIRLHQFYPPRNGYVLKRITATDATTSTTVSAGLSPFISSGATAIDNVRYTMNSPPDAQGNIGFLNDVLIQANRNIVWEGTQEIPPGYCVRVHYNTPTTSDSLVSLVLWERP